VIEENKPQSIAARITQEESTQFSHLGQAEKHSKLGKKPADGIHSNRRVEQQDSPGKWVEQT